MLLEFITTALFFFFTIIGFICFCVGCLIVWDWKKMKRVR